MYDMDMSMLRLELSSPVDISDALKICFLQHINIHVSRMLYFNITFIINAFCMICANRLMELSEAIEALDAAIEYKSDIIAGKEAEIRRSQVMSQVCTSIYFDLLV